MTPARHRGMVKPIAHVAPDRRHRPARRSCASVPTQTKSMADLGAQVSSEAIRVRIAIGSRPLHGAHGPGGRRGGDSGDQSRGAPLCSHVKIGSVPSLYRTLFNQRPLIAILDTWAAARPGGDVPRVARGRAALGPGVTGMLATLPRNSGAGPRDSSIGPSRARTCPGSMQRSERGPRSTRSDSRSRLATASSHTWCPWLPRRISPHSRSWVS